MEKQFRPLQPRKETKGHKVNKPDLRDHQGKDHEHGTTVSPKSQHKKHHHQNQDQHHYQNQQESHPSNENDSHDTNSTVEGSSSHHHHSRHHYQQSEKTDPSHPHHYHHKQKHRHVADKICHLPVSGTSSRSPSGSSSSSFSSSSSSTSSSSSSTSPSTSTTASSSMLSSDSSSESFDRHLLRKPQHSQSCTDISRRRRASEEEDDTTPLIDDDSHLKLSAQKKQERATLSHRGPHRQRIARKKPGGNGSVRKAKSMEALSRPEERDEDEEELERRRNEARKGKLKFSAFLNEITRQVLSPVRLTSLGVTDAHKPRGPGQAPVAPPKTDSRMGDRREQRSRPASADSMSSSDRSRGSAHSQVGASGHSRSEPGVDRHRSRHDRTGDPPRHTHRSPKSYTDIRTSPTSSCSRRRHSRSPTYKRRHHDHGDHRGSKHHHRHHRDHHSPIYHHEDHHNATRRRGRRHSPTHRHGRHKATRDRREGHHRHRVDHRGPAHRHHRGEGPEPHRSPSHSKNNDPESRHPAPSEARRHHSGPSLLSDSEHSPTRSESHRGHRSSHPMDDHRRHPTHEEPRHRSLHDHDRDEHHSRSISLPSDRKPESDSSRNSQDEEQTSYTGSSLHKDKAEEMGRIMMLQVQNEDLQKGLLKTTMRMECLGEEFMSSHQLLEAELQRTRMELSDLLERFKRLQDNCSSTQQTNNLLEQKLHSVAHNMEGQRERLNQRISELTEQLANAKLSTSMETLKKTSALHKTVHHHFQSDDSINRVVVVTPPPAQFMDSHDYGKTLGSVPEEEESDWSEMGEETPRFILMGPNAKAVAFSPWGHREGEGDIDSESGGEEILRQHSQHSMQIPHLQFTVHSEILPVPLTDACHFSFKNLSDGMTGEGGYRFTTGQKLVSPIPIRSASLEEIPLTRQHMQEERRGTEAMMDLHHPEDEAIEDSDNEIIHHWRAVSDSDTAIGRCLQSRTSEPVNSLAGLQSAQRMLNHFICELPSSEGDGQVRVEVQGWTGGLPDEVLNGERTQL